MAAGLADEHTLFGLILPIKTGEREETLIPNWHWANEGLFKGESSKEGTQADIDGIRAFPNVNYQLLKVQ